MDCYADETDDATAAGAAHSPLAVLLDWLRPTDAGGPAVTDSDPSPAQAAPRTVSTGITSAGCGRRHPRGQRQHNRPAPFRRLAYGLTLVLTLGKLASQGGYAPMSRPHAPTQLPSPSMEWMQGWWARGGD